MSIFQTLKVKNKKVKMLLLFILFYFYFFIFFIVNFIDHYKFILYDKTRIKYEYNG